MIEKTEKTENTVENTELNCEYHDFSEANFSEESRIHFVTKVASICYQSENKIGSENLYNRLLAESIGLPSSSFEFIPILINLSKNNKIDIFDLIYENKAKQLKEKNIQFDEDQEDQEDQKNTKHLGIDKVCEKFGLKETKDKSVNNIFNKINVSSQKVQTDPTNEFENEFFQNVDVNVLKYGTLFTEDKCVYLLTNLRALINDIGTENSKLFYNTKEEAKIIKKRFFVFKFNTDLVTRTQMIRHRVSWQELSRRYVSGKKVPITFYYSDLIKKLITPTQNGQNDQNDQNVSIPQTPQIQKLFDDSINIYNELLSLGVKPQEARRVLPQGMMTQLWGAFNTSQIKNFINLRDNNHSQNEIKQIAKKMREIFNQVIQD